MKHKHMILVLEGPLAAYTAARVDRYGTTHEFPTLSMMTGLLANALGYDRMEHEVHQRLQRRLVFACRSDRQAPRLLREFQTAQIQKGQRAWTTAGEPEERGGGTYRNYDMRQEYHQDSVMTVALRLTFPGEKPDLEDLAEALISPERPLFIGKKHSIPTGYIMAGWQEGDTALEALRETPLMCQGGCAALVPVCWPPGEGIEGLEPSREVRQTDVRNWRTGVHGGERHLMIGTMPREWMRPVPEAEAVTGNGTENGDEPGTEGETAGE